MEYMAREGNTAPQTIDECFAFERQKRPKLDALYTRFGAVVQRIEGKKNKDYDAIVKWRGRTFTIEEKYLSKDYNELCVETVQDTKTNSPGWIEYTKADYLIYATDEQVWCVKMEPLKKFVRMFGSYYPKKVSKKGWGITEIIIIPWGVIDENGIGKQIWEKSVETGD